MVTYHMWASCACDMMSVLSIYGAFSNAVGLEWDRNSTPSGVYLLLWFIFIHYLLIFFASSHWFLPFICLLTVLGYQGPQLSLSGFCPSFASLPCSNRLSTTPVSPPHSSLWFPLSGAEIKEHGHPPRISKGVKHKIHGHYPRSMSLTSKW